MGQEISQNEDINQLIKPETLLFKAELQYSIIKEISKIKILKYYIKFENRQRTNLQIINSFKRKYKNK